MKSQYICLLMILVLWTPQLIAQSTQKGRVLLINSQRKPLEGVEILVEGTSPVLSDSKGNFEIKHPSTRYGELIFIKSIAKSGYEVVNKRECSSWVASPDRTYEIIMCQSGYLEACTRKYYNIGVSQYKKKYEDAKKDLDSLYNKNQISFEKYSTQLDSIQDKLIQAQTLLETYSAKFAHVNKDDLNELDSAAFVLLEQGKVDEAIDLYESSNIINHFIELLDNKSILQENINTMIPYLINEIEICICSNEPFYIEMAKQMLGVLLSYDPSNKDLLHLSKQLDSKN